MLNFWLPLRASSNEDILGPRFYSTTAFRRSFTNKTQIEITRITPLNAHNNLSRKEKFLRIEIFLTNSVKKHVHPILDRKNTKYFVWIYI